MRNKLFLAALLATLCGLESNAQLSNKTPKLIVNITIDQLRSDYMEFFMPYYSSDGFARLFHEGLVYEAAQYPFTTVDRASAIGCLATGTPPEVNKIIAKSWLKRETLRPEFCVADQKYVSSPNKLATTTISDEMKISTGGKALVYGFAENSDAAILSVGHAADGAFWMDDNNGKWTTSMYYPEASQIWIRNYKSASPESNKQSANNQVAEAALDCMWRNSMGLDDITDYLAITLSAYYNEFSGNRNELQYTYTSLDNTIANLLINIEQRVGKGEVLFVVTATGVGEDRKVDFDKYHIPTGTFYINRTAQLLNMYLSAVYGSDNYIESYYKNQIYLNHKVLEDRKLSFSDVFQRSKELLLSTNGVAGVTESPYDRTITGDIWVEVRAGWKLYNEDTRETILSDNAIIPFPVMFLGNGINAEHVKTPVTTERIAPTIAKTLRIRAPNGCNATPLF